MDQHRALHARRTAVDNLLIVPVAGDHAGVVVLGPASTAFDAIAGREFAGAASELAIHSGGGGFRGGTNAAESGSGFGSPHSPECGPVEAFPRRNPNGKSDTSPHSPECGPVEAAPRTRVLTPRIRLSALSGVRPR